MSNRTNSRQEGFTLIELLIVVAIIAILAAIAVPNFLEAQTRSKISRVMADMRSLGTAIEGYSVDYNRPPMGIAELSLFLPSLTGEARNLYAMACLTTPVAYISSILQNPFGAKRTQTGQTKSNKATPFYYQSILLTWPNGSPSQEWFQNAAKMGYSWMLQCWGPSRVSMGNPLWILTGYAHKTGATVGCAYDSSNGTVSLGYIIRTNKGQFAGPGS